MSNLSKVKVIKGMCPQNHKCPAVKACPKAALIQDKFEAPKVDLSKCIGCKVCVKICPMGAIQLEDGK